jgi:phytoene desaturase
MEIAVIGAGIGGLAAGVRLAHAGHSVVVFEAADAPGGKCGRVERDGFAWDSGPSLLTMPWVLRDLFEQTGAPLEDELELLRVEPVTRYHFADGSRLDLSADLPQAMEALEAWSPGAGADWIRFLGICGQMWRASVPFLTGPPPWPPRRPSPSGAPPDPRDLLRVRPWWTLRGLAAATVRDPRLRMIIERFATYAGADPRRAPAALAVAGYVEHAFGAWHPRGGLYGIVRAMVRRLELLGGELRCDEPVASVIRRDGRATGVQTRAGAHSADLVVVNVEPPRSRAGRERSLSGFALMLGLEGRTPGLAHHTITFPADYDAEFDDVFRHRRPVRDPTLYASVSCVTDPSEAPPGTENWFVLANAPARTDLDWSTYGEHVLGRLGAEVGARVRARAERSPADLERETGAAGGAIYGDAPHGRLGTLKRPPNAVRGTSGLWRVGGTTHPGGGLPLVMLSGQIVAREIGPA